MINDFNKNRYQSQVAWLPAAIQGGASFLGSLFNFGGQNSANKSNLQAVRETNKANRELAEYQTAMNLEQWNRENAYNHPIEQMARFQAAGLNPNLVYDNGATTLSAKSPDLVTSRDQAPHFNPVSFDAGSVGRSIVDGMSIATSLEKIEAETSALGAQESFTQAQTFKTIMEGIAQLKRNGVLDQQLAFDLVRQELTNMNLSKDLDVKDASIKNSYQNIKESEARIGQIAVKNHVDMEMLKANIARFATTMALQKEQMRGLRLDNDLSSETYQIRYQNAVDQGTILTEDLFNASRDGRIKEQTIKRIAEERFRSWYPHASNPIKHLFFKSAIETAQASGLTIDY